MSWTPKPPYLSDKLADWQVLAEAGGEELVRGKIVIDAGPCWGVDALCLAYHAQLWLLVDSSVAVLQHLANRQIPGARNVLPKDLTQPWDWAPAGGVDLVLDFSSFDDTTAPLACYENAVAVLRPGGVLITTFANGDVILGGVPYACQSPNTLSAFLHSRGLDVTHALRLHEPRAGIIARRPA